MKYKVGDKVKVRSDLVVDEEYGDGVLFVKEMSKYCGMDVPITASHDYGYSIGGSRYNWVNEMFEEGGLSNINALEDKINNFSSSYKEVKDYMQSLSDVDITEHNVVKFDNLLKRIEIIRKDINDVFAVK